MMKFGSLTLLALCSVLAVNGLVGCNRTTSTPAAMPTATFTPTFATPTAEVVAIHPGLEIITPGNLDRLERIDQWGQGQVNGIALSPDGNLIAVATTTGIYLYDRSTAQQTGYIDIRIGSEIEPEACSPSGILAFSPDSSTLAISYTDIMLWDLKAGTVQKIIKNKVNDASIITGIQFSLDGSRIFGIQKQFSGYPCYSGWGSLVIYAVETGELIFRRDYRRYEEGPGTIFLEKDGIVFVSYRDLENEEYHLLEVDLKTGEVVKEKPSPGLDSMSDKTAVIYKWVSAGDNGGGRLEAHIVDLISFKEKETLNAQVELIPHSVKMIILEQQELTIRTLGGTVICSKSIPAEAAHAFLPQMFSSDGRFALGWNFYGDQAGEIRVWDLKQCTISEPILILPEVARDLSISSDGQSVLTGSQSGYTFHVFDAQTGQMRFSLPGSDAHFSADGQQVFVAQSEAINAYDVETGEYLYPVFETDSGYISHFIVSPNGKFLAIPQSGKGYQIVRISNNSPEGNLLASIDNYPYFSPDGRYLATINGRQAASELRFWELSTGNELTQWWGLLPRSDYRYGSFNSDFTQFATFGTDGAGYEQYVYIWDIPSFSLVNALIQPRPNNDRHLNSLEFISDDRLLFARGINPDAFLVWEIQTGNLLYEIPAEIHESELGNPVIFSPDGYLILVLDNDATIHVFGVPSLSVMDN